MLAEAAGAIPVAFLSEMVIARMDASVISALSALGGAAVGGLTSGVMSWLTQEMQAKAQESAQDKSLRQQLYREFIEQASKSYGDALQHSNVDVSSLVGLYAKISRMRVLSSTAVTERADQVMRMIVDTYMGPNKSLPELREMMVEGKLDALRDFSEACRIELGRNNPPSSLGPVSQTSRPERQTGGVLPEL